MPTRPAALAARPFARPLSYVSHALSRLLTPKASRAVPLFAVETTGQPVWTPRDYTAFAREGVMQNAIVYRCVRMIAEAAASVPLCLYQGVYEIESHPLLDLLSNPSPGLTGTDMLEAWFGFLMVSGNTYLEAVSHGDGIKELHVLRPDRMHVIPGPDGWPEAWEYIVGNEVLRITGEGVPGVRPVLQMKLFHPANDHYGLSPIEAAATAIDLHNAASRWNKALLDNSARPSGALVYSGGTHLNADQFERLKSELEVSFQGARNAGRPLLLEGGLDWKAMSLSPRDMDFLEAKHTAAREIALAMGVPPMLLGIPGDNTYSNLAEANRAFWRQTILPLTARSARALTGWLAPAYGSDLRLVPDTDEIPALASERDDLWARLQATTFLTDDEKRAAIGYGPKGAVGVADGEGGETAPDLAAKFDVNQPRVPSGQTGAGRWTSGGSQQTATTDDGTGLFDDPTLVQNGGLPPTVTISGDQAGSLDGSDLTLPLKQPFSANGQPAGIYTNGAIARSNDSILVPGPAAIVAPGMTGLNAGKGAFSITGFVIGRRTGGGYTIDPAPGQ